MYKTLSPGAIGIRGLSLAEGIVHGTDDAEEEESEADHEGKRSSASAVTPRARRAQSQFANAPEDHFPQWGSVPAAARECHRRDLAETLEAVP